MALLSAEIAINVTSQDEGFATSPASLSGVFPSEQAWWRSKPLEGNEIVEHVRGRSSIDACASERYRFLIEIRQVWHFENRQLAKHGAQSAVSLISQCRC